MATQILKQPTDHGASKPETLDLTDALAQRIARFNGSMSPVEVRDALLAGLAVHTNHSVYRLVPQPHHDATEPKLMLPRGLDPESVLVLAGVARELAERKGRGEESSSFDAGYLDAHAGLAALSYSRSTPAKSYACLLQLAAVAVEQANLIARAAEKGTAI
jgi:hypothetical protein